MSDRYTFFSVIIPVYNAEAYLHKCIQSVLFQHYPNCEIVLINDGSQDSSGEICNDYAGSYENVQVIHQENKGVSEARNAGLRLVKGEYLIFLDSDDYLTDHSLFVINEAIQNAEVDMIVGYWNRFYTNGDVFPEIDYRDIHEIVSGIDFYSKALYQGKLTVGPCCYIYKLKLLKRYNFRFGKGLLLEDELWTPTILYHAEKVLDLKFRFYNYRLDNGASITHNPDWAEKRSRDLLIICKMLANHFDKKDHSEAFCDNICALYMYAVYDGKLWNDPTISRSFPLKYARTKKYVLKALLFFISPHAACILRGFMK